MIHDVTHHALQDLTRGSKSNDDAYGKNRGTGGRSVGEIRNRLPNFFFRNSENGTTFRSPF
ncbi:hypothetical protein LXM25_19035 [Dyadobacter sp. LJ53]|uniref:hypothetical protein n=1 Tax=Dyadobacter chenwenxiniae TaxID=2906456 RepID=UPI001F1D09AA|nr:hypothetical protein [Dyadobacter chenwenxiniae]MCF0052170.1 hypothetical protein [Dyadobacter chenwenxiniae]